MNDVEELKRKKEYLELQKEVAELEKKARINKTFSMLSNKITIPLLLVGLIFLLAGLDSGEAAGVVFGIILAIPFILKFFLGKP